MTSDPTTPHGAFPHTWEVEVLSAPPLIAPARQSTALLSGLRVDTAAMSARLSDLDQELRSEQRMLAELAGHAPATTYLGLVDDLVDEAISRAQPYAGEAS